MKELKKKISKNQITKAKNPMDATRENGRLGRAERQKKVLWDGTAAKIGLGEDEEEANLKVYRYLTRCVACSSTRII